MENMHVLVCVTGQKSCERLIVEGARLAAEHGGELSVLHVATQGAAMLGYTVEGDALEYLYKISCDHGADMTVVRSDAPAETIAAQVRKKQVSVVVMGQPRNRGGRDFMAELRVHLPDVQFHVVYSEEE